MIERAQGVVARHPEFAFGHDVLAVAYEDGCILLIRLTDAVEDRSARRVRERGEGGAQGVESHSQVLN